MAKLKTIKSKKTYSKGTKMAGLPKLPSDLTYYRQSDGKIGIREKNVHKTKT